MSKKAPTKSDRKKAKLETLAQPLPGMDDSMVMNPSSGAALITTGGIPPKTEQTEAMDKMQNQYRNPPDLGPSLLTQIEEPKPKPIVRPKVPSPRVEKPQPPTRQRKKASEYRIYQEAKVQPTEGTGLEPFTVLKEVGDVPCASREKALQLAETAAKDNPNKVFHVHRILGRLINKEALAATLVRL